MTNYPLNSFVAKVTVTIKKNNGLTNLLIMIHKGRSIGFIVKSKGKLNCWFLNRPGAFKTLSPLILILTLIFSSIHLNAQQTYTLSGYIKDQKTGENLKGANIIVKNSGDGAVSNDYGFYSLSLEEGEYVLVYSFVGYAVEKRTVNLNEDKRINISLKPEAINTDVVEIEGERPDANIENVEIGSESLDMEKVEEMPALLGEVDVLKTLQLLPGVQSAGEGSSGFRVRGGGPNQNLVLLDEAVVYNTGHLFGFFSVFNSDAINNTELIKGGIPARYGGRLSSVVDISMKEGNTEQFQAEGGVGLISSKLTLEGPFDEGNGSFMVSGRRTYIDVLTKPFIDGTDLEGNSYYFYDLNAKANYRFSDKDRIFLSGYFGRDVFEFSSNSDDFGINMPWGNSTATLRWNHLFDDKLFMNATAVYNDYNFEVGLNQENWDFELFSGIQDWNFKTDFSWYPDPKHSVKFGLNYTYHTFIPSTTSGESSDGVEIQTEEVREKYAHEGALYIEDEFDISEKWRLSGGLRFSLFNQVGPYDFYRDDELLESFDKGESVKTYTGFEPRLKARYKINDKSSVKASYTRTNQYIHLVSNSGTTLPTDVWVPSTKNVRPERANQYAGGYFRNFNDNMFETSIQVYYRDMDNQIEYDNGYQPQLDRQLERDFVYGWSESFGTELYIKKRKGDFTGWISYTLSKTTRFFDDLRTKVFPSQYDRRHDLSVVGNYQIDERWNVSGTFVYGTGQATTIPVRRNLVEGTVHNVYGERNGYRLPDYHRFDISVTLGPKNPEEKDFHSSWVFSVYNVYNQMNPFFIYFENEGSLLNGTLDTQAKQVSLFPIIPSIRWKFEFNK